MKKILSLLLIVGMLIATLASCGNSETGTTSSTTANTTASTSTSATTGKTEEITAPSYTVEELMNKVIENIGGKIIATDPYDGAEFEMAVTGPIHFDASNKDTSNYYTGLDASAALVEADAVYNENMFMGGAPFSMVIVKVKDTKDVNTVKEEMFNGINMRKWVCVNADHLITVDNGNYVLLVMCSQDVCENIANSFDNVLSGASGTRLAKNFG